MRVLEKCGEIGWVQGLGGGVDYLDGTLGGVLDRRH